MIIDIGLKFFTQKQDIKIQVFIYQIRIRISHKPLGGNQGSKKLFFCLGC